MYVLSSSFSGSPLAAIICHGLEMCTTQNILKKVRSVYVYLLYHFYEHALLLLVYNNILRYSCINVCRL